MLDPRVLHLHGAMVAQGVEDCEGEPARFDAAGIEALAQDILVVKSTQHFHAGFAPVSAAVLYAGEPGALTGDPRRIRYVRAPVERLWPLNPAARPRGLLA